MAPGATDAPTKTLKVALYSGVVLERDAVSRSLLWKFDLFGRLRDAGFAIEVVAFAQASERDDPAVRVISDVTALVRDPFFKQADLHIFEYGMCYDLFNILMVLDRPSLVIDHNTTPPALIDDPVVKAACEKAELERNNLFLASHVATDSEFTRDALLALGMPADDVSVLHLPATNSFVGRQQHNFSANDQGDEIRLTYVGRLVRAKGLAELLSAVARLWDRGDRDLRLCVAGSLRFSDPDVVDALVAAEARYGGDGRLTLELDADDERVATLFGSTDIFVMPSHHEGYCVPVVEALMSGCYVIGSDAGNIPVVMGGLGTLFACGDVDDLTASIAKVLERIRLARAAGEELVWPTTRGDMALAQWHRFVAEHLLDYSMVHFESTFLAIVRGILAREVEPTADWLAMLDAAIDHVHTS